MWSVQRLMLSFFLTVLLLTTPAPADLKELYEDLDWCPKSIFVDIKCKKSAYPELLKLISHSASYILDDVRSQDPKEGDREAGIQRCFYNLQKDSSWSSTYKISGTIYKDVSNIQLLKHILEEYPNPIRDRKYVLNVMLPFVELHFKKDSDDVGPITYILFTGLEYLMTREQMVQKESHEQSESVAAIQINSSNPQTTEDDFVITGSECEVKIQAE